MQRVIRIHQFGVGSGHGFFFLLLLFVLAAVATVIIVSVLTRGRTHHAHASGDAAALDSTMTRGSDALRILDERLARGEIDTADYTARRDLLVSHA